MYIFRDEDILDLGFRQKVIREIAGAENQRRKQRGERRHELARDKTVEHVIARLESQGFSDDTVSEMRARAANVSIYKKIVKKKSRAYSAGVDRTVNNEAGEANQASTKVVQGLAKELKVNQVFRKGDEAREIHRNALVYCHPIPVATVATPDGQKSRWSMTARILHAHQFDVIPLAWDKERAGCIILSDFPAGTESMTSGRGALGYRDGNEGASNGDGVDQTIADSREDSGAGHPAFIWWTRSFHFTTDKNGAIITGTMHGDGMNPIKRMPFVELAKDQDGEYWGEGGDDLTEAAILINLLITDLASILSNQGYGQPVLIEEANTGSSQNAQKEEVPIGPRELIRIKVPQGSSVGDYKLVSTDVPADSWIKLIELYVALTLTTNNLSPRNISGKLDAVNIASGIAKMIDESESTEDLTEAQQYYAEKESEFWEIVFAWLDVLKGTERLDDALAKATSPPDGFQITPYYKQQGVVLSEQEKLDLIKKRKEIGLTLFKDLIQLDDANLTDEQALKLLEEILAERAKIRKADPTLLAAESSTTTIESDMDEAMGGEKPPATNNKPEAK